MPPSVEIDELDFKARANELQILDLQPFFQSTLFISEVLGLFFVLHIIFFSVILLRICLLLSNLPTVLTLCLS